MYLSLLSSFFNVCIILELLLALGNKSSENKLNRLSALKELRSILPPSVFTKDFMKTDYYLSRWLEVCDSSTSCAAERLIASSKWRHDQNMTNIESEVIEIKEQDIPYKLDGFDRRGNPILQMCIGRWDIRKIVLAGKGEEFLRFAYQLMDRMENKIHEQSRVLGHEVKMYGLFDAAGYSIVKQACFGCVQLLSKWSVASDLNSPLLFKNMTVINVPRLAESLLTTLKGLLSEKLAKLFNVLGGSRDKWRPLILHDIDPGQITTEFGGNLIY